MERSAVFSVMRRRDDLPEMRLPLAILFMLATALTSAAAARLASPAADAPLHSANIAGLLASLPFLPLAVMTYALVILLWRRLASLLATPLSFGAMLLFGARFAEAFSLTLAILFASYVFAVSLISKETRFRRIASLAVAAAIGFGLAAAGRVAVDFGSFAALTETYMKEIPALIATVYSALLGGGETFDASLFREMARDLFVMTPAYFGMICVGFAWFADLMIRRMFTVLGCEAVFTDEDGGVTLPPVYAAIYAGVFVLTLLTPSETAPLLHAMFKSALLVMALPCSAVGVRGISERLEEKLFYVTREKLLAFLLLFVLFSVLGAFPFMLLTSVWGAVFVLRRRFHQEKKGGAD